MQEAFELAPDRVDLGVALARAYQSAGHDPDAAKVYGRLLTNHIRPTPTPPMPRRSPKRPRRWPRFDGGLDPGRPVLRAHR